MFPLQNLARKELTDAMAWIRNYICCILWNVIIHLCPNFSCGVAKARTKLSMEE